MSLYNFNTKDNPYSGLNSPTRASPPRKSTVNPYQQPKLTPPSYKIQQRQLPKQFKNREYEGQQQAHRRSATEAGEPNGKSSYRHGQENRHNKTKSTFTSTPQVRFSLPNPDSSQNSPFESPSQRNRSGTQSYSPFRIVFPNEPIHNDVQFNYNDTPRSNGNSKDNINNNHNDHNDSVNTPAKSRGVNDDIIAERILKSQPQLVDMQAKVMVSVPEEIWRFHQARKQALERLNGSPVQKDKFHRSIGTDKPPSNNNNLDDQQHQNKSKSLQYIISETIDHYRREEDEAISTQMVSPASIPRLTPIKNYTLTPKRHDLYLASESPLNKYRVSVPLEINLPPYLSPQNKNKKRNSLIFDGDGYSTFERELDDLINTAEGTNLHEQANSSSYSGSLLEEDSIPLAANDISFDISRLNPTEVDKVFGIDENANVNLKYQNRVIRNLGDRQKMEAALPQLPSEYEQQSSQRRDIQQEQHAQVVPQGHSFSFNDISANISNISTSTRIATNAGLTGGTPERPHKPLLRDISRRDLTTISQQYEDQSSEVHPLASINPYRESASSGAEGNSSSNFFDTFGLNTSLGPSLEANERLIDEIRGQLNVNFDIPRVTTARSTPLNTSLRDDTQHGKINTLDPHQGREHALVKETKWGNTQQEKAMTDQVASSGQITNFNDIWRQQEERHQQQVRAQAQLQLEHQGSSGPLMRPPEFYANDNAQEDSVVINPSFTQSYSDAMALPSGDNSFVGTSTPPMSMLPHPQFPDVPARSPLRMKASMNDTSNHTGEPYPYIDVTEDSIQIISEKRSNQNKSSLPLPPNRPQSYIDHVSNLSKEREQETLKPMSSIQSFGNPITADTSTHIHPYRHNVFIDDIYREDTLKIAKEADSMTLRRNPSLGVGSAQSVSVPSYTNSQFSSGSIGTSTTEPMELIPTVMKGPPPPSTTYIGGGPPGFEREGDGKHRKDKHSVSNRRKSGKRNKKNKNKEDPNQYKIVRERQNGKLVNVIVLDDTLDNVDVSRNSSNSSVISGATTASRRSLRDIERHHQILNMCEEIAFQAQEVFNGFTTDNRGRINN